MTHESQGKIKGKFYPLQNEEWVKACQELKPAERDVLYYLRTLDPFGNSELELGVSALALALGRDKSTVSRALKALDQMGWIDLQLLKVKVKLHSHRRSASELSSPLQVVPSPPSCPHTTELSVHNQVVCTQLQLSVHNSSCLYTTPVVCTQQSEAKTRSGQGFFLSKTYIDFKDSLSEGEREKFFDFVGKEIKNFTRPISDLEAWLASETKAGEKRWQVYYEKFKEREERARLRPSLSQEIEERRQKILAKKRASKAVT